MFQDLTITLGHYALFVALAAAAWSVIGSLLGATIRGRGLQHSAERALLASTGLVALTACCLIAGFLANDFRLDYVYHYSSSSQAVQYKIGALWGGQAGSLLLWVLAGAGSYFIALWLTGLRIRTLLRPHPDEA